MGKLWEASIEVLKKDGTPNADAGIKKFEFEAKDENQAKLIAMIEVVTAYPLNDGWWFDKDAITIREITLQEIEERLEKRRAEIALGRDDRLRNAVEELRRIGVNIKMPDDFQ